MRTALKLLTVLEGGLPPLTKLLAAFNGAGDDAGILRTYKGSPAFAEGSYLLYHLGNMRYMSWDFNGLYGSVGAEVPSIQSKSIKKLWKLYNATTTPAVTEGGAGWSVVTGAQYYGGRAAYNSTTGRYLELTTSAGVDRIGLTYVAGLTTLGAHLVTIDGDATAATSLPTAQDLVNSGALANTVLVANGGNLNPTDRIFDNYPGGTLITSGGKTANYVELVSGIASGSHVVRITVTGYHNVACSNNNLYYVGIVCGGEQAALRLTSGGGYVFFTPLVSIWGTGTSDGPVDFLSYSVIPTGATNTAWMGHSGTVKVKATATTLVDGSPVTMTADQEVVAGTTASVIVECGLRHPEIDSGNTDIANFQLTHTIHKTTGLTISHTTEWLLGGVGTSCFPGMMGVDRSAIDRFTVLGYGSDGDLAANNSSVQYSKRTQAGYAWDYDGSLAVLLNFPLSTVTNWSYTGSDLHWVDVGSAWDKLYILAKTGAYTQGDIWAAEFNYRTAWFSGGANAALSGKY